MFPRVEDEPLSGLILGREAAGWLGMRSDLR